MKAPKIAGFAAASAAIIAATVAGYWYFAVYASASSRLQRACQAAILNQVYVPDSTHFLLAFVDPQPVSRYLRMVKFDMQGSDVVDATKQLTRAKALSADRLGEIGVAFVSENRMGVPLRGMATCTYKAAPGMTSDERLGSVSMEDMSTVQGGSRLSWLARVRYKWHAARQPVTQNAAPQSITDDAIRPAWAYSTVPIGEARVPTVFADLQSTNVLVLAAPYDQPQTANLDLWRTPPYWQFSLHLDHGQFDCSDNCVVLVYFDGKLQSFNGFARSVSGHPYLDFGPSDNEFVEKLQTAKKVQIDMPVFDNGYVTSEFNVAGFDVGKFDHQESSTTQ